MITMKKSSVLFALIAAGMATSVSAAEPAAFNVQQLVNLNKLHSAAVSNDGKTMVYGVKVNCINWPLMVERLLRLLIYR